MREREERATKPAHELLNEVGLLAEREGVRIKKEVVQVSDTVGKAIIDYAKTNKFDVIIIGTTGMGRVQRMFLGSVANYVIHNAHCSVFAVR
ncbi:universal stress protein [Nitrososphaera sp. AFS]|nr:universal stress protein [Nitrososphaera sp. AFS]